ncbi:hypothetical protein L0Y59_02575 [Candidatus Uhrbacteria bacterium]|nr:hypothetical protein [Candidatus Uhrbacteria bacterium]
METTMVRRLVALAAVAMLLVIAQTAQAMPERNTYRVVETSEKGWVVEVGPDTGFHILASDKMSLGRAYKEATGVPLTYKALDVPENWETDKQGRRIRPKFIPSCHHKGDGFEMNPTRDIAVWNTCAQNGNTPIAALVAGESGRLLIRMEPVQTLEEKNKELDEFRACQTSVECLSGKLKDLGGEPVPTEEVRKIQDERDEAKRRLASAEASLLEEKALNGALAAKADIAGTISRNFGTLYSVGLALMICFTFFVGRWSNKAQAEAIKHRAHADAKEKSDRLEQEKAELVLLQREAKTLRNLERDHKTVSARVKELEEAVRFHEQKASEAAKRSATFEQQAVISKTKREEADAQIDALKKAKDALAAKNKEQEETVQRARAVEQEKARLDQRVKRLEQDKADLEADLKSVHESQRENRDLLRSMETGFKSFEAARVRFEIGDRTADTEALRKRMDEQAMFLLGGMATICSANENELPSLFSWMLDLDARQRKEQKARHTSPMNYGVAVAVVDQLAGSFAASQSKAPDGSYSIIHGVEPKEALRSAPVPKVEENPPTQVAGARMFPGAGRPSDPAKAVEPEDLRKTAVRQESPFAKDVPQEDAQERVTIPAPDPESPFERIAYERNGEAPRARVGTKDAPGVQERHMVTDRPPAVTSKVPMGEYLKEHEGRTLTNPYGFPRAEMLPGSRPPGYDSTPPPPVPAPSDAEDEEGDEGDDDTVVTDAADASERTHSTVISFDDAKRGRKKRGRKKANGS